MDKQNDVDAGSLLIIRNEENKCDVSATKLAADEDFKEDLSKEPEEEILQGPTDVVIIDNGTYMVKAGTANKQAPTIVHRCLVSKDDVYMDDIDVGQEDDYTFTCPLDKFGRLRDKTQMGKLWHKILKQLGEPDEFKVLLTEPPHALESMSVAQDIREKMLTLMDYNVGACYIANDAQLALYSTGNTSGTVVDMGHSMTYITPIYEGHVLNQAVQMTDMAGRRANEFLKNSLSTAEWKKFFMEQQLHLIKQTRCYVSYEPYVPSLIVESQNAEEENYQLPDGTSILLKKDILVKTPELFFNPSLVNSKAKDSASNTEHKEVKELIANAVRRTPVKIRNSVSEVFLSGGSSMFSGMVERLKRTLSKKFHVEEKTEQEEVPDLTFTATPYRKYATWIGGSILASLEPFKDKWITKEIVEEEGGTHCVHKRIFW